VLWINGKEQTQRKSKDSDINRVRRVKEEVDDGSVMSQLSGDLEEGSIGGEKNRLKGRVHGRDSFLHLGEERDRLDFWKDKFLKIYLHIYLFLLCII
jgi:hypothetical protein